ncbi:hypothetical protein LJR238_005630 [Pararhizobium sp. LjRoot238]
MAGLDMRIDHRSHAERGLQLQPTEHIRFKLSSGRHAAVSFCHEGSCCKYADIFRS